MLKKSNSIKRVCPLTPVQNAAKHGLVTVDRGTVPSSASELELALFDTVIGALCDRRHLILVLQTEADLFAGYVGDAFAGNLDRFLCCSVGGSKEPGNIEYKKGGNEFR